ncbi:disease resistance protein L6-like [Rhodamnia argentea]|uniref:Disease resistance protein L6-like n=1 Tax=Rhodamnia argentea TaxID=178133 RepID=A0ABM3H4N1_9MYRT|nr:disease resistance protein L6-like [Rhodamnia argentea]
MKTEELCYIFISSWSRHFANRLLAGLSNAGISVFRDEKEVGAAKEIDPTLVEAIGQSKTSIPIISLDYASSESCFMGLAKMLEWRDTRNHAIVPIFYGVDPSDIGSFAKHNKRGINWHLDSWKSALHRIGQLKGYRFDHTTDQDGRFISELILYVTWQLKNAELLGTSMPVGINNQVRKPMTKLDVDYRNGQAVAIRGNGVRMAWIHGIGGIGKTTLAKFIYSQLYPLFEGCSYLGNIREVSKTEPLEHLQSRLVSDLLKQEPISLDFVEEGIQHIANKFGRRRVLIVLDDVHESHQLKAFAGKLSWFGSRSKIIVTTRNTGMGYIPHMFAAYEVKPMKFDKSLCLFCRHAFGESSPRENYEDLSEQIVSKIGGIPLVIEVLGSFLYRKKKETWDETLHQLRKFQPVCLFFIGQDKRIPFYMWEDCDFCPSSGIDSLLLTSLVKIRENNKLSMYGLLRDLGLAIVRDEDPANPGRRSRLWNHEEALGVLRRKEMRQLKVLNLTGCNEMLMTPDFSNYPQLEMLILERCSQLVEIHPSIRDLTSLVSLNLKSCSNLSELPRNGLHGSAERTSH